MKTLINQNEPAPTRWYYLQHRRQRQTDGVGGDGDEGAKRTQEDGRAMETLYSAEMRRQRVLGMYGMGVRRPLGGQPKGSRGADEPWPWSLERPSEKSTTHSPRKQ